MAQPIIKPSIEWPTPQINDGHGALEDVSCLIERLLALMKHNIDEMQEAVINRPVADEFQASWINNVWMIFRLADEKLQEVDTIVTAIVEAGLAPRRSSLVSHTQQSRSRDWRLALNAANAANTSADMSDGAIALAGRLFEQAVRTRVGSLDDFREKLGLLDSNCGFTGPHLDELFRDLDALGARASRELAA